MTVIIAEVAAQVATLVAEGKTLVQVAKAVKVKKADECFAELETLFNAETAKLAELTNTLVDQQSGPTAEELAALAAASNTQVPEVKAEGKSARAAIIKGDKTLRDVVAIFSPSLKQAFLTTNVLYSHRDAAKVVEIAKKDLANKKKLGDLLKAADLQSSILAQVHKTDAAGEQQAKIQHTAEWTANGFAVLSSTRKVEAPAAAPAGQEAPADDAAATETPAAE